MKTDVQGVYCPDCDAWNDHDFDFSPTSLCPRCRRCLVDADFGTMTGVTLGKAGQGSGPAVRPKDAWDARFLALAEHVADWSKDPSTQVGAVIVDPDRRVVSVGYNGFAMGVGDDPARYADRDEKLMRVVHAEVNAILSARRDVTGFVLYTWPFMPCCRCSGLVIQAGIARVVAPPTPERLRERWQRDTDLAASQFAEAGVELVLHRCTHTEPADAFPAPDLRPWTDKGLRPESVPTPGPGDGRGPGGVAAGHGALGGRPRERAGRRLLRGLLALCGRRPLRLRQDDADPPVR